MRKKVINWNNKIAVKWDWSRNTSCGEVGKTYQRDQQRTGAAVLQNCFRGRPAARVREGQQVHFVISCERWSFLQQCFHERVRTTHKATKHSKSQTWNLGWWNLGAAFNRAKLIARDLYRSYGATSRRPVRAKIGLFLVHCNYFLPSFVTKLAAEGLL